MTMGNTCSKIKSHFFILVTSKYFLMFEVVTLKSLGLEVTGMRKGLDIVEHVFPIVISYKVNSIYKRNVP